MNRVIVSAVMRLLHKMKSEHDLGIKKENRETRTGGQCRLQQLRMLI